jgi:hypothetical protein
VPHYNKFNESGDVYREGEISRVRASNRRAQSLAKIPSTKPIPTIECVQTEWRSAGSPRYGLAVFKNIPNEVRRRATPTATDVTAMLMYRNAITNHDEDEEAQIYVSFGTWFGSFSRYASISAGRTNSLIVAVQRDNKL